MSSSADDVELLKALLSDDPPEELTEQLASYLIDEIEENFPELSVKTRPVADVLEDFRENKLEEVESEDQYDTKIDYIEIYLLDELEIETTEDISSEDVEKYKKWRKHESLDREEPLADSTLKDDLYLFGEFVDYLIQHRMAPKRFEDSIELPEIEYEAGEGVDEKSLDPEIAKAALDYLRKYNYADVEHVTMELFCNTGTRKGGAHGRDVDDFDYKKGKLVFEHSEETPLKNDEASERKVTLFGETPEIVRDYLRDQRPPETDSEGRKPLLTKGDGRIDPSTLQKIAYKWTRPCKVGLECPHDRDPENCEAAQNNNAAYKCPSSRAPHHIRTGYITDQKNRGVSAGAIDQRCDVSEHVQNIHYDQPDKDEERERYEDEFRNADDDPDSGYSHA